MTYSELDCVVNRCSLTIYDVKHAVLLARDKFGDIVIVIASRNLKDEEIAELIENIINYYREQGDIIILSDKRKETENYVIYGYIEILTKEGQIIRVIVR